MTAPVSSFCRVERDGQILIVTMDRPSKLNAINSDGHAELDSIWDDFFADPELHVAILTGAGDKAFCAGSDLSDYQRALAQPPRLNGYGGLTHRLDTKKPIIAAVNGLCYGGGFELMLCCDLAIAADQATFALSEAKIGACAFAGGIPRLCRKVPHAIALELLITGRRMDAAEANRWGLVNRITSRERLLDHAKDFAREILRCAPLAVRATKQVVDAALSGMTLAELLVYEDGAPKQLYQQSADLHEGVRAFLEKRSPVWRGA